MPQWYDANEFLPPDSGEYDAFYILSIYVLAMIDPKEMVIACAQVDRDTGYVFWRQDGRDSYSIGTPICWAYMPVDGKPGEPVQFPPIAYLPIAKGETE